MAELLKYQCRNPFYIRSSIPTKMESLTQNVIGKVAIPSTSGQAFLHKCNNCYEYAYRFCRNPFYIRSSIPTRHEEIQCFPGVNPSQSLLHQVKHSYISKSYLARSHSWSQSLLHQVKHSYLASLYSYLPAISWCRNPFYIRSALAEIKIK